LPIPEKVFLRLLCWKTWGSSENPIADEELFQKYRSCASGVLPEKSVEESIKLIMNLEKVDDIGKLMNILAG